MLRHSLFAKLNSKTTMTVVLIVVAALTVSAIGARSRFAASPPPPPLSGETSAPQEVAPRDSRALVVALNQTGFEPSEVTVPAGEYLLVFKNRAGLDEFALRLEREGQGTVREGRPPRLKREWRQVLRLTPGNYVVTELNHPEWTLRLTVTPR